MIPHERSLVERVKDKPFVLLGVNSDKDPTWYAEQRQQEGVTWRSFWCGDKGTFGAIPTRWNVTGWPTIYVLDHMGVIRFKNVRGEAMDKAVDQLLTELEQEAAGAAAPPKAGAER